MAGRPSKPPGREKTAPGRRATVDPAEFRGEKRPALLKYDFVSNGYTICIFIMDSGGNPAC